FVEVSWEEAFADIGRRVAAIQEAHGRHAVATYTGNPTVHNTGALLGALGLYESLGTFNRFSATSVDQLPHMLASLSMFGHQLLMPVPDVDRAGYLLMLGANPLVSNGSIMTAPGIKKRLRDLQKRGGRLVVVDPRRTETAALADEHVFVRPGSDGFFLMGLIHVLYAEERLRPGRLRQFTDGFEVLGDLASRFSPEAVAAKTGIAAETTRRIARELAEADRPCVYGRMGVCTQRFGGLNGWLLLALNVLLGALDREGGMMFTKPAIDLVKVGTLLGQQGHFGKGKSRVRELPEFGGEYPAVTLAEEIDTPGEGRIRGLFTLCGNPVLSVPNGRRLDGALASLDLMVSIDLYKNETSRHAHYILPPTSQLESGHYDLAFHAFTVRNTAKYSLPLFTPPADSKSDFEILVGLASQIASAKSRGLARWGVKLAGPALLGLGLERAIDLMLRTGPYGALAFGRGERGGLSLAALARHPSGVDLGALEPCLPERLFTKDKRIQLVPPTLARDVERLKQALEQPEENERPLLLIGRRQLRTNNSWLHNVPAMVKGRDRCTLLMHPTDAAARGLADGARVVLESRVGRVEAPLAVSDEVMPGVVSLPHGFGHGRPGVGLQVAAAHPGISCNDVTDEGLVDPLTGTAVLNGVPVEVSAR
ncbi:MAG: molybdopterin oxidoreductase family protein, partial [Myxococcales bacterium]|nr:molybdopterin oxidoreductase family protein [Myxococcales bacterium]